MKDNNPIVHGKSSNKRIWALYNESLVRRMKDILDLKDIEDYRHDLRKKNRKKNGLRVFWDGKMLLKENLQKLSLFLQ